MPIDLVQIILIAITVLFALLTLELKNILHAVISFAGMCMTIGAIYWLLNAPYVAVFQLLIYAGAIVILFLATIMLTSKKESLG